MMKTSDDGGASKSNANKSSTREKKLFLCIKDNSPFEEGQLYVLEVHAEGCLVKRQDGGYWSASRFIEINFPPTSWLFSCFLSIKGLKWNGKIADRYDR